MPEQQLKATGNEWVDEQLAEIAAGIQDPKEKIETLLNLAAEMLPSQTEVLQQAREAANADINQVHVENCSSAPSPPAPLPKGEGSQKNLQSPSPPGRGT
jgi:hypothetical protein